MIKKMLIALLVIVVSLLLFLAIILIPAHLQIRSVAPSLPTEQQLLTLKSVDGPISASYVLTSAQKINDERQIAHISILLEWASGKTFMLDAGMDQYEAMAFSDMLKSFDSNATDAITEGSIAEILGRDIHKISSIGFTHLHIDHTQGVKSLCKARGEGVVVLQSSYQANLHNFNTTEGADIIKNSCLQKQEFNGEELAHFESYPGLGAFTLGGHTPGSTLWVAALPDKILLFSGDITNDKNSIDHDQAKSRLYSTLMVPENVKRTAELRKWLLMLDKNENFSVIVAHDLQNTQQHIQEYLSQ